MRRQRDLGVVLARIDEAQPDPGGRQAVASSVTGRMLPDDFDITRIDTHPLPRTSVAIGNPEGQPDQQGIKSEERRHRPGPDGDEKNARTERNRRNRQHQCNKSGIRQRTVRRQFCVHEDRAVMALSGVRLGGPGFHKTMHGLEG